MGGPALLLGVGGRSGVGYPVIEDLGSIGYNFDASGAGGIITDGAMVLASASSQYLNAASQMGVMNAAAKSGCFWYTPTSNAADQEIMCDGETGAAPFGANSFNFRFRYIHASTKFNFDYQGYSATTDTILFGSTSAYSSKHLVCWYYDPASLGEEIALSIDGSAFTTAAHNLSVGGTELAHEIRVGADLNTVPAGFANGTIDEIGFFDGKFTAADVSALWGGGIGSKIEQWQDAGFLSVTLTHSYKLAENGDTGYTSRVDNTGSQHFTANGAVSIKSIVGLAHPTAVDNNEPINQWTDFSTGVHHATNTDSTKRMLAKLQSLNLLTGSLSDGANDQYSIATPLTLTDFTAFIVCNQSASAASKFVIGGNIGGISLGTDFDERAMLHVQTTGTVAKSVGVAPVGAAMLLTFQYSSNAATAIIMINGVNDTGVVTPQAVTASSAFLGGRVGPSGWWPGNIYQVVVYPSILSLGGIVQVNNSLKAKWGTP